MEHDEQNEDNLDLYLYVVKHRNCLDDEIIGNYVQSIFDVIKTKENIRDKVADLLWQLIEESQREVEENLLFEDIHSKINLLNSMHIIQDE